MHSKYFIITMVIAVFLWFFVCCEKSKIPTEKANDNDDEKNDIGEIYYRVIATEPDWSPDGKYIAYVHMPQDSIEFLNGHYQIWLLNLETMENNFLTTAGTVGGLPDWSPDGKKIVYIKNYDIYVIEVETKQITKLTNKSSCYFPSWSPDGQKIAYDMLMHWPTVPFDSAGIWIISADGLGKKQVVRFDGRDPDWSPDGDKLVFIQASADKAPYNEISVVNINDSLVVRLTNNDFDDLYPSWSPDGNKIAWNSFGEGGDSLSGIWVMNADGTDQKQLTKYAEFPSWSPDGKQIVYSASIMDAHEVQCVVLWLMNADGTNPRPLITP